MCAAISATAILLAAGFGTRMKSALPKVAHPLGGRPMLQHLIASVEVAFERVVVVRAPEADLVDRLAHPHPTVQQHDRLGTAHAALQAAPHFGEGDVAVLYADNPLITPATLSRLRAARAGADLVLLAMRPQDTGRYGRVVTEGDRVIRIVEHADASEEERAIGLCNAGVICADAATLRRWLEAVGNDNAKGEYYLTDVVELAHKDGAKVVAVEAPEAELRGINSRIELAAAEATFQHEMRLAAMEAGVTLTAPDTVIFSYDTELGPDVLVQPHVVFGPGVRVEGPAEIKAFSHLEGCSVSAGALIGPYARLRPGTVVGKGAHVGNFVELKATDLGAGAKANHLAYLGDSSIGPNTNIGAGTITCNYDGVFKHRTEIGADVFVGSDSVLIAPVKIGDDALIAAGSVITRDVEPGALAFGRAKQSSLENRGTALKKSLRTRKEKGEKS